MLAADPLELESAFGDEQLVSQFTKGRQKTGTEALGGNSSGDFVATFSGRGPGDSKGVFAQRYDVAGATVGDVFRVNQTTRSSQQHASVAVSENGDFVIAWSGKGSGDSHGVFVRKYNSLGEPLTNEMLANATVKGRQERPVVAIGWDGSFVVAWSGRGLGDSHGVFARQFHSDGTPAGDEFRVNSTVSKSQKEPAIALGRDGSFVIAWQGKGPGDSKGIFLQRFRADGSPEGEETRVNSTTKGTQQMPSLAMDADGNFVVVWEGRGPGDKKGVFLQRFFADGTSNGAEERVNATTSRTQADPSVAMRPDGSFVVTWSSDKQDGSSWGVFGQEFDSNGQKTGGEFQVNTTTKGSQRLPSVAVDDYGFMAVGSGRGVDVKHGAFAHRFDTTPPEIQAELLNDTGDNDSDGLTSDATIRGSVQDAISGVAAFRAIIDGGVEADVPLDATGVFTFDPLSLVVLSQGEHTVSLVATDAAGNVSTLDVVFTLDSIAPAAPAFDLHPPFDSPPIGDMQTTRATVSLIGRTEANATVTLQETGATTTANPAGRFRFDGVPLELGPNLFTVRATDAAGNVSTFTKTITRIDPTPPVITAQLASDTGTSNSDRLTSAAAIEGNVVDQFTAVVSLNAQLDGGTDVSVAFDAQGDFTFDPGLASDGSQDGQHTVTFTATDLAGNEATLDVSFTLDTVSPTVVSTSPVEDGEVQAVAGVNVAVSITFSEQMDASTVLAGLSVSGNESGAITPLNVSYDEAADTLRFELDASLTDTDISVTVADSTADLAGNRLASSFNLSFVISREPANASFLRFLFSFGSFGNGDGQFSPSGSIAIDGNGRILVGAGGNGGQVFDSNASFLYELGGDGTTEPGNFITGPYGVAFLSSGNIVTTGAHENRVQVFDNDGTFLFLFGAPFRNSGNGPGEFDFPLGVAVDGLDRIIVIDARNSRFQVFDDTGAFLFDRATGGFPDGVAVDASGNIYVVLQAGEVKVFDSSGGSLFSFDTGLSIFDTPRDIVIDPFGNILVTVPLAREDNTRILRFDGQGNFIDQFTDRGSGPGQYLFPRGMAFDSAGRFYLSDGGEFHGNNRINVYEYFPP